jgi:hypothetical protein
MLPFGIACCYSAVTAAVLCADAALAMAHVVRVIFRFFS